MLWADNRRPVTGEATACCRTWRQRPPDPAEAAEIADTAARVRGAIAALADGQQDAVRLFYLQGLSHREVAEELGISAGAVKARLHQARAALAPNSSNSRQPRRHVGDSNGSSGMG